MAFAGIPANEAQRLAALASYDLVGADRDPAIQAVTSLASRICETPMAIVSVVDRDVQWFLASVGLEELREVPRADTFCAYTILDTGLLEVEDASIDERFADDVYVVGEPRVRFYAGYPLIDAAGHSLGALCVLDYKPRRLDERQQKSLEELATTLIGLLETRRSANQKLLAIEKEKATAADLRAVLDSVPALVAYTDAGLRNRFANQTYARSFDTSHESMSGRHIRDILGPHSFEKVKTRFDRVLGGEPQVFEGQLTHGGAPRDMRITLTPDLRDGQVFGYVTTMMDVTELRDALRRSEARNDLLAMAENIAEIGHWRVDFEEGSAQEHIFWSPIVFRIHGRDPSTFVPTMAQALDAYHPDDRAAVKAAVESAIATQTAFEFERRVVRPDGTVRVVLSKGRAEVDPTSGKTTAIFGVFQDITERSVLRERVTRQERLVTTGTLAAGVGHEINNPLTYVAANVEFAIDELRVLGGASPSSRMNEVVDVLVEAREGAERIRKIVRGLRAFAREDTSSVPTDVHAALEMSINMAMHELRQRATLDVVRGAIRPVLADESRLSQVFVNLLVNAAQAFSNGDTVRNRIKITTRLEHDESVVVEVNDNGTGIAPDVLERIFDPFFTTKAHGHGTGLGLSICHNVVTALGGEITCATIVGKGTTFKVTLPAAPVQLVSGPPPPSSAVERGRVLLVDDEESVLRALLRLLGPEHDVTALADSREAQQRLVEGGEEFDVVFCDVMMPRLSGVELFRSVRAVSPKMAERFVFITGGTIYEEVRAFLAEIPNERLEKPFSNQNLKAIARRFVALARARAAPRVSA